MSLLGQGFVICVFYFFICVFICVFGLTRLERDDIAAHVSVGRLLPRSEVVELVRPLIPVIGR